MRIGLFDSGIGGLTVLKSFLKYHPNNEYFYYGDTLNNPYGNKSKEELYRLSKNIINYLYSKNVDIIIIACGTVSANLYDILKEETKVPIYSIIEETLKYVNSKNYNKTLVMATNKTIESHIFKNNIKNEVIEVACPKLVPIIEGNDSNSLDSVLDEYVNNRMNIDSLILGCTHYPLAKENIMRKLNKDVDIIDMGEILARRIEIKDSKKKIDLFFSKKVTKNDIIISEILKNM